MVASRSIAESKEKKLASTISLEASFFSCHWRKIIYGIATILVLVLGICLFFFNTGHSEQNYLKAEMDFQQYLLSGSSDHAHFEHLQGILRQSPLLLQKYQALLAQELTKRGEWDQAQPYVTATIEGAVQIQPLLFEEYSQASLLIGQKKYKQALDISKNLNQILSTGFYEQNHSEYTLLGAYNLLRIASLEQEVGTPAQELQAWIDYKNFITKNKQYLRENSNSSDIFSPLQNNFLEGNVSLNDYITHREAILKTYLTGY